MEININVLKDLGEAISAAADAVAKITNGIRHLAVTGTEGYDAVRQRRAQRRLISISSRSVRLQGSNMETLSGIRDYGASWASLDDQERSRCWMAVLQDVETAFGDVSALSEDLDRERSKFVLESTYAQLRMSLAARKELLTTLRGMSPPASAEELRLLNRVVKRYDDLVGELASARDDLNAYVRSLEAPKG